jgi:GNAT superfamily N-acetyltransferase
MDIQIKPLVPELADDYFDFFENRAFTDNSPYRCYCQVFQMTRQQYQAVYEDTGESDIGHISREVAERQIANGVLQGYLAYADGKSIGWCNANDRSNYPVDPFYEMPFHAPPEKREIAVVCFEIAPEYRSRGVATALLDQVLSDARTHGYLAVVSFPVKRDERYEWDWAGPVRLYEKAGFVKVTEGDDNEHMIMKKELL